MLAKFRRRAYFYTETQNRNVVEQGHGEGVPFFVRGGRIPHVFPGKWCIFPVVFCWNPRKRTHSITFNCLLTFSGVARICCEEGKRWKLCHEALTVDFRAGCSSCLMTNSSVTNGVLIERAASCWHLHQLISQTTQYLDSWLSDLLQSELKMKLLEGEGTRAPVPHIAGNANAYIV